MRISDWSSGVCSSDLGTLYGRNTLAGAINLITRRPSGEFGGSASLEIGNYNAVTEKASIDLPKVGIVSMSLAARQEQRGGWVKTAESSSTNRSDERRVGQEGVSKVRSRWSPDP